MLINKISRYTILVRHILIGKKHFSRKCVSILSQRGAKSQDILLLLFFIKRDRNEVYMLDKITKKNAQNKV